jgi:perosamine synthetase
VNDHEAQTVREPTIGSLFGEEEMEAIRNALINRSENLSWGHEVAEFEREFAQYCGAQYAVAVSSCSTALDLCAHVLRLGREDEVIATPQTFWATISALVAKGVRVRFADVDPSTLNIDPSTIERLVTERTKALYVVHYGGNPANLGALREIAQAHSLVLVEDCAHAPGARFKGTRIGSGDLCCFSFQSYKNMTTLGEGGMVTTNQQRYAEELRRLRHLGVMGEFTPRVTKYIGPYPKPDHGFMDHSFGSWDFDLAEMYAVGSNFRMPAISAAVGSIQLRKLEGNIAARRNVASLYDERLSLLPEIRPTPIASGDMSSWHLYTCFLDPDSGIDRNKLLGDIRNAGKVEIVLRYMPLHLTNTLRKLDHAFGECPVCERVWFESQINLPIGPAFGEREVDIVVDALAAAIRHRGCN